MHQYAKKTQKKNLLPQEKNETYAKGPHGGEENVSLGTSCKRTQMNQKTQEPSAPYSSSPRAHAGTKNTMQDKPSHINLRRDNYAGNNSSLHLSIPIPRPTLLVRNRVVSPLTTTSHHTAWWHQDDVFIPHKAKHDTQRVYCITHPLGRAASNCVVASASSSTKNTAASKTKVARIFQSHQPSPSRKKNPKFDNRQTRSRRRPTRQQTQ